MIIHLTEHFSCCQVKTSFDTIQTVGFFAKAGMQGSPTVELFSDNCRFPAGNLMGKMNERVEVMTRWQNYLQHPGRFFRVSSPNLASFEGAHGILPTKRKKGLTRMTFSVQPILAVKSKSFPMWK